MTRRGGRAEGPAFTLSLASPSAPARLLTSTATAAVPARICSLGAVSFQALLPAGAVGAGIASLAVIAEGPRVRALAGLLSVAARSIPLRLIDLPLIALSLIQISGPVLVLVHSAARLLIEPPLIARTCLPVVLCQVLILGSVSVLRLIIFRVELWLAEVTVAGVAVEIVGAIVVGVDIVAIDVVCIDVVAIDVVRVDVISVDVVVIDVVPVVVVVAIDEGI